MTIIPEHQDVQVSCSHFLTQIEVFHHHLVVIFFVSRKYNWSQINEMNICENKGTKFQVVV